VEGLPDEAPTSTSDLPPCLPSADITSVARQWLAAVAAASPSLAADGRRLLARLMPPNWSLEWSLPYWLGLRLGLAREAWLALVLSNVTGLAYVRLQDDLLDHGTTSSPRAANLVDVLHGLWLRAWLERFSEGGRFWDWYEECMAEWAEATWQSLHPISTPFRAYGQKELLLLAHRGAPLKICIAAACLLSGKMERARSIAAAVDALLTGAVLFDHVTDWEEDVRGGRFNVFHSYAAGPTAVTQSPSQKRLFVMRELMVGESGRPYFRLISGELQKAALLADQAGMPELAAFAGWLEAKANRYGEELGRHARTLLQDAVAPLLERAAVSQMR
jgi:hypothetical protein